MNAVAISACLVVAGVAGPALAQPKEHPGRRERATPGMVLETGARTAACDALTFTADGKHLLAAGDDKVVRSWAVNGGALAADDLPTLRWPIFREVRGNIYTMALSPDPGQSRVVVAGHGQLSGGFAAAVLDRRTGAVLNTTGNPGNEQQGTVWASGFSPSGDRVALGTQFGAVWVWDLLANRLELVGRHDTSAEPDPTNHYVRLAAFDGEGRVVSVCGTGELCVWDRAAPGKPVARHRFSRPSSCPVVLSPDRKWIGYVPDAQGQKRLGVELVSFPDARQTLRVQLAGVTELPHRLAFSKSGRYLAVAVRRVGQPGEAGVNFFQERGGRVLVFDLSNPAAPPAEGPAQPLYAEAVAFHPDREEWLAVAGGANHEVAVWNWRTGTKIGEVPQPGRALWGVALSADGNRVSFQADRDPLPTDPNRRGAGPWKHFDLPNRRFVEPADFAPKPAPERSLGGWQVVTLDPANPRADVWSVEKDGKAFPLPWSRAEDDFPRCYAFLPARDGKPERLAVGHYWGASVFDLLPAGPKRVMVLRGHEGSVTALAASADGRRLVTASRDMTLAGWTLDDWPDHPRLGAELFTRDGKLLVGRVAAGSPAWEMGMETGAEIVGLRVPDRVGAGAKAAVKYDATGAGGPNNPNAALAFLRDEYRPGSEHVFYWTNPGDPQVWGGVTTLIDRPLWRFFPQADGEWVVWRWRDYYYDSSTRGDARIGWQRSYPLADQKRPEFFKAEQLRAEFLKPAKLAATLATWQTDQAVVQFNRIEPPEVAVSEPEPTADGYRVTVTAAPRGPLEAQQPARVLVWLNDYLLADLPAGAGGFKQAVDVPADKLRAGQNLVIAQCYGRSGSRADAEPRTVRVDRPAGKPVLHALLAGVGDYSGSKPRQTDLSADRDAEVLDRVLARQQRNGAFAEARVNLLLNQEVTRSAVLDRLAALRTVVRPDDLFVFYLGGHGTASAELRAAKVPEAKLAGVGRFVFGCPNFDFDRLTDTTLNFEDLADALHKLPCHKLLLLDACHSGAAQTAGGDTDANPVRILTQHGVGPVILAACGPDQVALEAPVTFDRLSGAAGVFTIALRRTLEDKAGFDAADTNKDGRLTVAELAAAVAKQVTGAVGELGERGLLARLPTPAAHTAGPVRQTPVAVIPRLEAGVTVGRQ